MGCMSEQGSAVGSWQLRGQGHHRRQDGARLAAAAAHSARRGRRSQELAHGRIARRALTSPLCAADVVAQTELQMREHACWSDCCPTAHAVSPVRGDQPALQPLRTTGMKLLMPVTHPLLRAERAVRPASSADATHSRCIRQRLHQWRPRRRLRAPGSRRKQGLQGVARPGSCAALRKVFHG